MNDEQLYERRHGFLTQRLAGGTYSAIAKRYNERAMSEAMARGGDPTEVETVSSTTVRKDVARAKQELIDDATREALRGEHRAILLDMRRANYAAMAGGDVDAAKIVMSTLQREAEMFGLDEPKRTQIGVGTDVEFANDLVDLIRAVGYQPPTDLLFAARGEALDGDAAHGDALAIDRVAPGDTGVIDVEAIPFDLDAPEPRPAPEPAPVEDEPDDDEWSNL